MASILDRYGIKEVADVVFLELGTDDAGKKTETPVLFLDTLKISTIETTAEQTEARGGKGNAPLIIWDYGKEITVTLQDALYSPKSMAMMFGDNNGCAKREDQEGGTSTAYTYLTRYKNVTAKVAGQYEPVGTSVTNFEDVKDAKNLIDVPHGFVGSDKTLAKGVIIKIYSEDGTPVNAVEANKKYIIEYKVKVTSASQIEISAATFPGTYKVIGDTYARSDTTGKDEFFQFIIHKAKMSSENTITLEAEGDPSVFDMNLRVMRPEDGKMMELIQYNLADAGEDTTVSPFLEKFKEETAAAAASTFNSRSSL